ncbi:hypothetical protein DYB32_007261 [Aphanomyces invadans]|uniref:Uncharacterized protein n=1 Tax=Aphanomyces invadans TaxID=157072 RepID=A0A418AP73_9STRA|nr:hypothetical protein DYB32_007261 [Aphanomyces invadans]
MSSETVEVVIAELIFRPEDEIAALDNDIDESTIAFARASPAGIAQLKRNTLLLSNVQERRVVQDHHQKRLSVQLVSHGLSFRQTANTTEAVRATFNLNKRTGINDNMVDLFVRVLVGVSIQKIGDLLATDDLWAMSMGFDGSSHRRMRSRAISHLGKLDHADMKKVIAEIGNFVLQTIMGLVVMQAERTAANEAEENASPVLLRRFCVGLATALPNTTSIESDFSILKWEKDAYRENLLDLSLEGIFQAKQFDLQGSL